jgi:hypothetical protein
VNPHLVVSLAGFGESSDACENPSDTCCVASQHARSQVFRITTTFCTFPSTILLA